MIDKEQSIEAKKQLTKQAQSQYERVLQSKYSREWNMLILHGLPIDTLGMQHLLLANSICWTALRHFSLSMLFDILVTAVWGHQGQSLFASWICVRQRCLILSGNNMLGDAGLKYVCLESSWPCLKHLNLQYNEIMCETNHLQYANWPKLKCLNLGFNKLAASSCLANFPNLQTEQPEASPKLQIVIPFGLHSMKQIFGNISITVTPAQRKMQ